MRRRAGAGPPVRPDQGQRSGRCGDTPLAKLLPRSGRRSRGSGDGKVTPNNYRFQMPPRRDTNAGRAKQVASGHRVSRSAHKVSRVRRETGKRRGCKSFTMKGRANHIGPESCAVGREAKDEALTGAPVGQVLSRESFVVRDADAVCEAEGNTEGCVIASARLVPRGLRPWHADETSCLGTGRSHAWPPRKERSALGRPEGRSQ
jgi:hypothetical protein